MINQCTCHIQAQVKMKGARDQDVIVIWKQRFQTNQKLLKIIQALRMRRCLFNQEKVYCSTHRIKKTREMNPQTTAVDQQVQGSRSIQKLILRSSLVTNQIDTITIVLLLAQMKRLTHAPHGSNQEAVILKSQKKVPKL